ncbi:iron-sulfur cluster assembly accessory protein [Pseudalkalibacillus hwajinpoensis]|uniref:HesB/IscA family protein n=1 Tax=Guptibacillus hwajinpoensis TaxID=208199 RepID=UPI00325C1A65
MIHLSEAAAAQVKEMMKQEEGDSLYLRVGVKGGGCTGLSYGMGFDIEMKDDDKSLDPQHGVTIIMDNESAPVLDGVKIDYKQNMMGGGFTIDNPNAIASCGCGSSFKTATNAGTPENC